MSLKHNTVVPSVSQQMTVHNTDTKGCDEAVNQLCQLYPEIASWQPRCLASVVRGEPASADSAGRT